MVLNKYYMPLKHVSCKNVYDTKVKCGLKVCNGLD